MTYRLIHGDCLDVMRTMDAASVDAVVTDPPYGLEFMGKDWDAPWKTRGERPASAGLSAGGYATGNGYSMRETPTYGKGWRNLRCRLCGHITSGASPCVCLSPDLVSEGPGAIHAMRAFQSWNEGWLIEALRVAKPGAHLLAFGGTRTFHRLTCAIEDAGWEIRDCLSYLYGSGFPKSHNIGCRCEPVSYDHAESGPQRDVRCVSRSDVPTAEHPSDERGEVLFSGVSKQGAPAHRAACDESEHARREQPRMEGRGDAQETEGELLGRALRQGPGVGAADGESGRVCDGASVGDGDRAGSTADSDGGRSPSESPALGQPTGQPRTVRVERRAQAGGSDVCEKCGGLKSARGYGTALKPAWEPVILARKPLVGTVAANYAAHGTGALNIDGCRIGTDERFNPPAGNDGTSSASVAPVNVTDYSGRVVTGRWPANVVLDEEAAKALDEQSGGLQSGSRADGTYGMMGFNGNGEKPMPAIDGDFGGASRFFYVAKASRAEREAGLREAGLREANVQSGCAGDMPTDDDGADRDRFKVRARNTHPTVKPVDLMRWLVRLVTPTGGVVLDPFTGSGTTGIAAIEEGCSFIGIEREAEYVAIAEARLRHAAASPMLPFAPTQVAETVPMQFDPVMP